MAMIVMMGMVAAPERGRLTHAVTYHTPQQAAATPQTRAIT